MFRIAVVASRCNSSRPDGLRVIEVHRRVHPDILDFEVLEKIGIDAFDVIHVLVRHEQQVEALLAAGRVRQERADVRDSRLEGADFAQGAAVDQHVKIIDGGADLSPLRYPTVEAIADVDVVGSD